MSLFFDIVEKRRGPREIYLELDSAMLPIRSPGHSTAKNTGQQSHNTSATLIINAYKNSYEPPESPLLCRDLEGRR